MAYVYVCNACLDEDHEHCEHRRDIPTEPLAAGGGHCICRTCRPEITKEWYEEVRESSQATRHQRT